jgi:catechol 2,3-dioxygenase-like lactoylglutathione lyase family enzyme
MTMTTNRRELLALLGAGAVGSAAEQPLAFTALDHVEVSAPDSAKTAAFYARTFGGPVWKNNTTARRYVMLGPCYIAIENGREPLGVDHFSVGIQGFQIAAIHSFLEQRGIAYRDYPSGKDLNVTDPDGIHVQLSDDNTWSQLKGRTASPEPGPDFGSPVFQPNGLGHILLNVSDPEKSAEFYAKIFGPITQRNNNRSWFRAGKSRIGLLKTGSGQKAGVNHFCIFAAAFDYGRAAKRLQDLNAKVEAPEVAGAPEFHDPDGLLVQVMAAK